MSRTRIAGGSITKITGGNHNMYSESNINIIAGTINERAEGGIVYGNDPEDAPKLVLDVISHECVIEFRPPETYKGEFGFDWMRINDNLKDDSLKEDYAQLIENGYNRDDKQHHEYKNQAEAYKKLEKEYYNIPIHDAPEPKYGDTSPIIRQYYVPYLQIFSEKYSDKVTVPEGMPKPPFEATLRTLVEIKGDEPEQIRVIFNSEFFRVNGKDGTDEQPVLLDTTPGAQHLGKDITIKCIKDFDSRKSIDVYMYPKITDEERKSQILPKRRLVGRIIVKPNDSEHRKKQKFVFVNVKTNIKEIGAIEPAEKINLQKTLHQCLVVGKFKDYENEKGEKVFDVSKDPNFMITTDEKGKKHYGKFRYEKFKIEGKHLRKDTTDGGLYYDYYNDKANNEQDSSMFGYLKQKFLKHKDNKKYENHFFVFVFEMNSYTQKKKQKPDETDEVTSGVTDMGHKNTFLFKKKDRDDYTLAHEGLHGLGLDHAHRDDGETILPKKKKFVFKIHTTNNVMSYTKKVNKPRISTWLWQWEIIERNLRKI